MNAKETNAAIQPHLDRIAVLISDIADEIDIVLTFNEQHALGWEKEHARTNKVFRQRSSQQGLWRWMNIRKRFRHDLAEMLDILQSLVQPWTADRWRAVERIADAKPDDLSAALIAYLPDDLDEDDDSDIDDDALPASAG